MSPVPLHMLSATNSFTSNSSHRYGATDSCRLSRILFTLWFEGTWQRCYGASSQPRTEGACSSASTLNAHIMYQWQHRRTVYVLAAFVTMNVVCPSRAFTRATRQPLCVAKAGNVNPQFIDTLPQKYELPDDFVRHPSSAVPSELNRAL